MAQHNIIGKIGEEIACRYLKKHGFMVVGRNYLRSNGEIDIIAEKGPKTHFIEVKTVSREKLEDVSCENLRPEENVTREKLRRLKNVISIYILENKVEDWSFDICAVFVDENTRKSKIRFLSDHILEE